MNKGTQLLFREAFNISIRRQCRYYLSQAYYCEDIWKKRLDDSLVKDIKPVYFYYDLIRMYKKKGNISAIDADLFMNSVHESGKDKLLDEMEEILKLLRRSPNTIHTLPSTTHAIIRHYLKLEQTDLILKLLSDPTNFGIFPSNYLMNVLMDYFHKKNNFTACARIASILMLQEDFGPPLTRALALSSCLHYILNQENCDPWVEYNPFVEPEEEVKILVDYIRNPYFDDHFDLKNPKHIVGKTLAWMSPLFESESLKSNIEILGWGLYQKWTSLESVLSKVKGSDVNVDENVISIISKELDDCEDIDVKKSIEGHLSDLKSKSRIVDINLLDVVEKLVKENVEKHEKSDIEHQCLNYDKWQEARHLAVEEQKKKVEREELIGEIEGKKKYLQDKEEVLFFFDNKLKLELKYAEKKQSGSEEVVEEEDYVVPELRPERRFK